MVKNIHPFIHLISNFINPERLKPLDVEQVTYMQYFRKQKPVILHTLHVKITIHNRVINKTSKILNTSIPQIVPLKL
jgi:hypothetical protein